MNAISLSYFLNSDTPIYGGVSGDIIMEKKSSIIKGDNSNNLRISLPVHSGTHVDFPYHFSEFGKKSNDYLSSFWIYRKVGFLSCGVNEVESKIDILSSDIELLILKTGFGSYRGEEIYWSAQPVIPAKLATILRNKFPKLRTFGFDMISLTSKLDRPEGKRAHINFLINNDIIVIEDMNLNDLFSAPELVLVSPLQLENADGAPCNVLAFVKKPLKNL